MPTRETRTHASMTIPLSSTRSSTSMRLVPPAARSTAILPAPYRGGHEGPPRVRDRGSRQMISNRRCVTAALLLGARSPPRRRRARQGCHAPLELAQLPPQLEVLLHH